MNVESRNTEWVVMVVRVAALDKGICIYIIDIDIGRWFVIL